MLPVELASRSMRLASTWAFLHAAGLPTGAAVVMAACAAHAVGAAVPLPDANFAVATATLLVAVPAAEGSVDDGAVAARAGLQRVVLTGVGLLRFLLLFNGVLRHRTPRAVKRPAPAPALGGARAPPGARGQPGVRRRR